MLTHYFVDARLNKAEYDSRALVLYVTEASGFVYKIGNVSDEIYNKFIEQEDPSTYFENYLLVNPKFHQLNNPGFRSL